MFRACEHQDLAPVLAADTMRQQFALAGFVDRVNQLADLVSRRILLGNLDFRRRIQRAGRESFDVL